ncbi:hypothetical protein, partial [Geitlerinema sp. PCC 9228]|uniref:hypothetical protein n=1 Tax=Geitlerinema sp. PCC 9228 TaxID=111611 RepID=UPI001B8D9824
ASLRQTVYDVKAIASLRQTVYDVKAIAIKRSMGMLPKPAIPKFKRWRNSLWWRIVTTRK